MRISDWSSDVCSSDLVIRFKQDDVAAHVREITDGQGVSVTFDGIGMATWDVSLKATARRGLIVSYGNAGGPVTGVRSEERRVGKECVSQGRSRWGAYR